jgi:uncharacterized damage-inducible protein DinB
MVNRNKLSKILLKQFENLEWQRAKLLNQVASLPQDQWQTCPPGKWSIAQVLSHIIASEQLSIRYLKKKMLGIDEAPETGIVEELKMITLIVSQRLPFKFKAPTVVTDHTYVYPSFTELSDAWEKVRIDMKDVLARFQENQLNRKIYKHPIAGMLNIKQAVQFFSEHIIHHTPQIKRLLGRK